MRVGILGDVHGNMEALTAVVAEMRRAQIDQWVQVGDLVGYGPEPSACIDLVQDLGCVVCLGNHDAAVLGLLDTAYFNNFARAAIHWTRGQLRPRDFDYLRSLALVVERPEYTVVHGTLHMPDQFGYVISQVAHYLGRPARATDFVQLARYSRRDDVVIAVRPLRSGSFFCWSELPTSLAP